ncbi:hypothetical protein FNV43_RR21764 [Rhamnella rubrinervis]|uniref:Uncharacterized protein n=1 Tax=Rhamnella rubrinervis TaxID=2594499 RepID=A0A8K0GQF5_9ROSA|nr:hypothetical protein FNV43_RR21764 [Rhamnella rubrinervis]
MWRPFIGHQPTILAEHLAVASQIDSDIKVDSNLIPTLTQMATSLPLVSLHMSVAHLDTPKEEFKMLFANLGIGGHALAPMLAFTLPLFTILKVSIPARKLLDNLPQTSSSSKDTRLNSSPYQYNTTSSLRA